MHLIDCPLLQYALPFPAIADTKISRPVNKKNWFLAAFIFIAFVPIFGFATPLSDSGLSVIPYPQKVTIAGPAFLFGNSIQVVLDKNHTTADAFTAAQLVSDLKKDWNIEAAITGKKSGPSIVLQKKKGLTGTGQQGYQLSVNRNEIIITAASDEGLFYGTQTFLQLVQKTAAGFKVIGLKITDWPDILQRAVHYDTKHHQDKISYVKDFIRELAHYKINLLIWEWEDKFAYPSHPEIGAPGAFTMQEMQGLTDYARQYHVQLAPLVQGLGHASFILKWPQFAESREIAASNFEFCPLRESSYQLLFDLWKDAMEATRGSAYIHIGSDETYELGLCEQCQQKAKEIGKKGLYHLFSDKAAKYILSKGRKPMIWETSMGWKKDNPDEKASPNKGLVLTEDMGEVGVEKVKMAKKLGYEVFFYDPNPGIEPIFLPYDYSENEDRSKKMGCLENSYRTLTEAARSGVFDGMIRTSWDDAGLHNQEWMLCFLTSAAYSWNGKAPEQKEFKETFFKNYYGPQTVQTDRLYHLLNQSAYYYWDSFERKVWHFGDVGKTYLPDLPRNDNMEYNVYWNRQYKNMVDRSRSMVAKMDSALAIIEANKQAGVKHAYDFEIFRTLAALVRETALTYLDLSEMEKAVTKAQDMTYKNRDSAYNSLLNAQKIVENNIKRRTAVFSDLVRVWEQTRLPKGFSTADKQYFYQQDRTRHFANRRADMSYFIYDEQRLDLQGWLNKLKEYMLKYKNNEL